MLIVDDLVPNVNIDFQARYFKEQDIDGMKLILLSLSVNRTCIVFIVYTRLLVT